MIGTTVAEQEQRCSGLRERKKLRLRHALRVAALERARSQGPEHFTVEEVCADVDVAPRTFFNHFPSKDAALFDWDEVSLAELAAEVRTRPEPSALAAATAVLGDLAGTLTTSPVWHDQLELLRTHPELNGRMARVGRTVEETVAGALAERDGMPEPELSHRIAAATAMAVLQVTVATWLSERDAPDARAVHTRVLDAARRAVATLDRERTAPAS
ncbi:MULTISPECIES: TetR/AcrR family transcriptional regulator [unclassified Pseudonocardia]|uniref:TetR/AcrR family transcriptional regulator n=1 Tax=unclassified Pseudonocardia TaxID=2619320 RepID=UPI0001FFF34B|nr:TetR/AcrR family transcriptional regulator [Pseudonocardia sp. Ae707_Ps1]OLM18443.1 Transcriptional regulator, TetR family [Pseudonocardia sp. Ae707_Ps1]